LKQEKMRLFVLATVAAATEDNDDKIAMPAFLSVPHLDDCTGSRNMGSWSARCHPSTRPQGCPRRSWNLLFGENGNARSMPDCVNGCNLSSIDGLFWRDELESGRWVYRVSNDYRIKYKPTNPATGETIEINGKVKARDALLEAFDGISQQNPVPPIEVWVACKNNPLKVAKVSCHYDPSAELGKEWENLTVDGQADGALPDCNSENLGCQQSDLGWTSSRDNKCDQNIRDDGTEAPGRFCYRRCTADHPTLGELTYESHKKIACTCDEDGCSYKIKKRGQLIPVLEHPNNYYNNVGGMCPGADVPEAPLWGR